MSALFHKPPDFSYLLQPFLKINWLVLFLEPRTEYKIEQLSLPWSLKHWWPQGLPAFLGASVIHDWDVNLLAAPQKEQKSGASVDDLKSIKNGDNFQYTR